MDLIEIAKGHPGAVRKLIEHWNGSIPVQSSIDIADLATEAGRLKIAAYQGKREMIAQLEAAWQRVKEEQPQLLEQSNG